MSWLSKHVLPKLKKIKPLKIIGQATGVNDAADAARRIGGAIRTVAQSASAEVQRVAREEEVSIAEAAARVAERAAGATSNAKALRDAVPLLVVVGVVVVAILLARKK